MGELRYTPWGEERSGFAGLNTDRTYTGQRRESFGLLDYIARYYDPQLGRFISADTIVPEPGNPQSLNHYAYAQNSPLSFIDPDGHIPYPITIRSFAPFESFCTKEVKMKRFILVGFQLFAVTAGFLCLTVGCTTKGGTGTTPTHTYIVPVTSEPDPLDDARWELVAFESEARTPAILEQPRLFIAFNRGELSLQGGCNAVSGHYRIENNRITITFVEATQVDCSDSMPGINEVEDAFSNAMPTFESYMIEDDQLRIRYVDGELLFRRVSE